MKQTRIFILGALVAALVSPMASMADATGTATRKQFEEFLKMPVQSVQKSEFAGLYEVVTSQGIIYTDAAGKLLIFGATVIDLKTRENLTEARLNKLGAFKFTDLPLADAIKTVRGNGKRVFVSFEDANCGYCKQLMATLEKADNVTQYTFLIGILSEDSTVKAKAIWCADDRTKVWRDYMVLGKAIPASRDCETPLDRNLALSKKYRVMGTPAMFFPSGERIPGAATLEKIVSKLDAQETKSGG